MTLVVERIAGLVSVQDLGRRGHMHESIPPGGALVRSLLAAANRLAGNPDGAPALEVFGRVTVRAESEVVVAADRTIALGAGETLEVISEPARVAYLAVSGGIDVPLLFGAYGALVSCGLGPILRSGDVVHAGSMSGASGKVAQGERELAQVRVIAGPDLDAVGKLDVLEGAPYRVLPASDRVGTRLAGPKLAWTDGYRTRSRPMVRGAIELPPDGQPIVLGPEHPTVGGHPIIGVIADADQDRFFATRIGGDVRFVLI